METTVSVPVLLSPVCPLRGPTCPGLPGHKTHREFSNHTPLFRKAKHNMKIKTQIPWEKKGDRQQKIWECFLFLSPPHRTWRDAVGVTIGAVCPFLLLICLPPPRAPSQSSSRNAGQVGNTREFGICE